LVLFVLVVLMIAVIIHADVLRVSVAHFGCQLRHWTTADCKRLL